MLLILWVVACGGGGGGADVVPVAGHWTVTENAVSLDDCGLIQADPPNGIPQGYTVTAGEQATTFSLQGDLENDLQGCEVDGPAWTCAAYSETESGSEQGATYTMTYTWQYTGVMEDEQAMQVDVDMQLSCTGSVDLCADIEQAFEISFPCQLAVSQQASAD